jgi:hypothetical protein
VKYAGLRLVAERDRACTACGGTGDCTHGSVDPAARGCSSCASTGTVTERQQLLHDGEPFFLLRGQDAHALATLYAYAGAMVAAGRSELHTPLHDGLARWFVDWQNANPSLVKHPD